MSNYKNLNVWKKCRVFIKEVYLITRKFPKEEIYGITSQIRRACVSISNNIVEGSGRSSSKDFARFLDIAYASAVETENLLIISHDLDFIQMNEYEALVSLNIELQKMIYALKKGVLNKTKD